MQKEAIKVNIEAVLANAIFENLTGKFNPNRIADMGIEVTDEQAKRINSQLLRYSGSYEVIIPNRNYNGNKFPLQERRLK